MEKILQLDGGGNSDAEKIIEDLHPAEDPMETSELEPSEWDTFILDPSSESTSDEDGNIEKYIEEAMKKYLPAEGLEEGPALQIQTETKESKPVAASENPKEMPKSKGLTGRGCGPASRTRSRTRTPSPVAGRTRQTSSMKRCNRVRGLGRDFEVKETPKKRSDMLCKKCKGKEFKTAGTQTILKAGSVVCKETLPKPRFPWLKNLSSLKRDAAKNNNRTERKSAVEYPIPSTSGTQSKGNDNAKQKTDDTDSDTAVEHPFPGDGEQSKNNSPYGSCSSIFDLDFDMIDKEIRGDMSIDSRDKELDMDKTQTDNLY